MKINVNRIEFLKNLKMIEKTITENKIKPIISCAYLEAREQRLFFCGTNLETTITTEMECQEIIKEGKIVFQYQMIDEYLKEIKDENISFSVKDGSLLVETSDSASEFSLMNVEDYPKIFSNDNVVEKEIFEIDSFELADMLEKVKYAASHSNDNLQINCIRVESEEKKLKLATTDTFRLVYLEKSMENISSGLGVSIPLSTVEAVTKLLKTIENGKIKFYFINKQLLLKMGKLSIISRIIDLAFPNYTGILQNANYNKKLVIKCETFVNILKRIMIFVKNNSESKYGATFKLESNLMEINGVNEIAKINENLPVNYIGENIKIALNTKFLYEFVQNLDREKEIEIEFMSSNASVKITQGEKNYVYILMPLALRD